MKTAFHIREQKLLNFVGPVYSLTSSLARGGGGGGGARLLYSVKVYLLLQRKHPEFRPGQTSYGHLTFQDGHIPV